MFIPSDELLFQYSSCANLTFAPCFIFSPSSANTSGDISKCPKCNYIAFAEKELTTFHCPQCSFKSCRECGDEAHPGIRCDEVETKTETDGRKNVEEAMTQVRLFVAIDRSFCFGQLTNSHLLPFIQ